MNILIKNGRVIDPIQSLDEITDLFIENNKISKIGKNINEKAETIIDATGKIVSPGFIDMHTHLREPGEENKETILTGVRAAIKGGFTTVCAMPNTQPAIDNEAIVKFVIDRARQANLANVLPIGTITKKREGKEISNMAELKNAGCLAISDDGNSVQLSGVLRRAMEYASMLNLLVISHCEDKSLNNNGVMHEGYWSSTLGLHGIPAESESLFVNRDIHLAELACARLHIAHVSSAKSIEFIRLAKKRGLKVTAEATPHHFSLSDESLATFNSNLKVSPPLRSASDVLAIKEALKDGTIDVIATDHAPHLETDKEKEFDYAPFGMIGLETALSLAVMNLVDSGYLTWPELISKLSTVPAVILGYDRGTLKEQSVADITIIDPNAEWVFEKNSIQSKAFNSPFIGWKLKAIVTDVIVDGRIVFKNSGFY